MIQVREGELAEEQGKEGLEEEGRFMGTERKGLPIGMLAQNEGNCRVGNSEVN